MNIDWMTEQLLRDVDRLRAEVARLGQERDALLGRIEAADTHVAIARSNLSALEDEKNTYMDYVGDALGQGEDESLWDAAQRVLSGRDRLRELLWRAHTVIEFALADPPTKNIAKCVLADIEYILAGDSRPCTCHPDDNPPVPCQRQYALTECREAALAGKEAG